MDRVEAKRLALADAGAADAIADAIEHTEPPRSVETLRELVGLSEALALCGRALDAPCLVWAADVVGDNDAPRGAEPGYTGLACACLVFLQALAKLLDPSEAEGVLTKRGEGHWLYTWESWGEMDLWGGVAEAGFWGKVRTFGNEEVEVPPYARSSHDEARSIHER